MSAAELADGGVEQFGLLEAAHVTGLRMSSGAQTPGASSPCSGDAEERPDVYRDARV
jgi:hypothetical protein